MKSIELQPTTENIYKTFCDDILNRNHEIEAFIKILNKLEDNFTLALDGKWGNGKTFFIKQVDMVLNSYSGNINSEYLNYHLKVKEIWENKNFIQPNNTISVYYDAWSNDDSIDPILSIIYSITKQTSIKFSTDKNYREILDAIIGALEVGNKLFSTGIGSYIPVAKVITKLFSAFKRKEYFETYKKKEELVEKINEFINKILLELKRERLVIFIDELDRCRPDYAIKLLERIKHYFINDKIIFVFSTNLEELQHTVRKFYGENFSGYNYLDRFFSYKFYLSPTAGKNFTNSLRANKRALDYSTDDSILELYPMELRDKIKFCMHNEIILEKGVLEPHGDVMWTNHFIMIYIIPLLLILRIKDIQAYTDFLEGNDDSHLIRIFTQSNPNAFQKSLFFAKDEDNEQAEEIILSKLSLLYSAIFNNNFTKNADFVKVGQFVVNGNTKHSILYLVNLLEYNSKLPYTYEKVERGGVIVLGNKKTGDKSVYHFRREDFLATDWKLYDDED